MRSPFSPELASGNQLKNVEYGTQQPDDDKDNCDNQRYVHQTAYGFENEQTQ
jgi:hypothetical protein